MCQCQYKIPGVLLRVLATLENTNASNIMNRALNPPRKFLHYIVIFHFGILTLKKLIYK